MCFHSQQTKTAQELENRFKVKFKNPTLFTSGVYNGFEHPKTPVITSQEAHEIQLFNWGLIPSWAKDNSIRKNTLNARIETLNEKASFKNVINNRCLILADGFYEWEWLDAKGKQKQKYLINLPGEEAFAFAGLWSQWREPVTGEILKTYTILTTDANDLMAKIHNTKKRMPMLVSNEKEWLNGANLILKNEYLVGVKV